MAIGLGGFSLTTKGRDAVSANQSTQERLETLVAKRKDAVEKLESARVILGKAEVVLGEVDGQITTMVSGTATETQESVASASSGMIPLSDADAYTAIAFVIADSDDGWLTPSDISSTLMSSGYSFWGMSESSPTLTSA